MYLLPSFRWETNARTFEVFAEYLIQFLIILLVAHNLCTVLHSGTADDYAKEMLRQPD